MTNFVSLVPEEYRKEQKDLSMQKSLLTVSVCIAIVMLIFFIVTTTMIWVNRIAVKNLQEQNDEISIQIGKLQEYDKYQQEFKAFESKIGTIRAANVKWEEVIYSFGTAMPDGTWFTSASFKYTPEAGRTAQLKCSAVSYESIALTIEHLKAVKDVQNVLCSSTSRDQVGDMSRIDFVLDVTFTGNPVVPAEKEQKTTTEEESSK